MNYRVFLTLFAIVVTFPCTVIADSTENSESLSEMISDRVDFIQKGDLDAIRNNRVLRVLVNDNKANFFCDKGRARGFEFELMNKFDKHLNRNTKSAVDKTHIVFVP